MRYEEFTARELRAIRDELVRLRQEVREDRAEQTRLYRLLDEFADTYLNAKFPYGEPYDRWRRRR